MAYTYDNLRLEKGMYGEAGRSFTQVLEAADPSENYRGTPLEGLDAFQRQLKRFDIRVKGAGSDLVDKFFSSAQSAVLFPEYIARTVRQGMEEGDILPHITAAVTKIDGMDYRSISSEAGGEEKKLKPVTEGSAIPSTTIKVQANLVKLKKRGRMLVASYEAVRFQKLDLFSVTLRQIGAQIGRMHLEDAIDVIVNGDGNGNAAQVSEVETAGTLSYKDLLAFWNSFEPYQLNTLLVGADTMPVLLGMQQMQDAAAGLDLIISKPDEPVYIMADGRHVWRVIDNLMNNICKYAQPGSRVYVNLEAAAFRVRITFRNISKYPLNISGEELMERFVRGDKSRNTEGHGLGLSIAQSLMKLIGGDMEIIVDGDLFKVILAFNQYVPAVPEIVEEKTID